MANGAQGWDIASETDAPAPPLGSVAPVIPSGWDVAGETPIETAQERMARHEKLRAAAPSFAASAKRTANAVLDAAGGALSMPVEGATGIASDLLGQSSDVHDASVRAVHDFIAGPENPDLAAASHALADTGVGHAAAATGRAVDKGLRATVGNDATAGIERVGGDIVKAAPLIGPAARAVGAVAGIDSPAVAAARLAPHTVVAAETAPDKVLQAAGYRFRPSTQANMTGAAEAPSTLAKAGEQVGGSEAIRAENLKHNRGVSNGWAATDIGLPRDTVLTPENIAKAEEAPSATYDRVKDALSDRVAVSPETRAALEATNTPDILGRSVPGEHGTSISLLSTEPMNAEDLIARIRALRDEGYKRTTAEAGGKIDPAVEHYGDAQIDAANALEKELDARVNNTNPKLAGDYQAARKLFAKINTVKRSLKGYNVDPSKLAKAAAKTDAIDGGLKIVADANTHAPTEVGLHVPAAAGLTDTAAAAGASGLLGGAIAAGYGHPVTGALLASVPVAQHAIRKVLGATRGETAAAELDATAQGPLGNYFGRDDTGFRGGPTPPPLELTPPPGQAFAPHQPSVLRSGEALPVAESTQTPRPGLALQPPEGTAFEAHQPGILRPGERVPAAESTQTPQPNVRLTPPLGDAFGANQGSLPLPEPEPTTDFFHGGAHPLERFSDEHIGTGEGNQSFSRGHNTATERAVAESYVPEKGGYLMHGRAPTRVVNQMLDWDKPLKDQPAVLKALGVDPKAPVKANGINPEWSGQELHDALAQGKTNTGPKLGKTLDETKKNVSDWLNKRGIPGTKFLDGKSRKGGGTQNLVFFNPDDATIVSSTKVGGSLGDRIGGPKVGGELSADDLKLAE